MPAVQDMMDALSGQRLCLKLVQKKLQQSNCFEVILTFLEADMVFATQTLSRKFYDCHVPKFVRAVPANTNSFLTGV